jgi:hypothetical protein
MLIYLCCFDVTTLVTGRINYGFLNFKYSNLSRDWCQLTRSARGQGKVSRCTIFHKVSVIEQNCPFHASLRYRFLCRENAAFDWLMLRNSRAKLVKVIPSDVIQMRFTSRWSQRFDFGPLREDGFGFRRLWKDFHYAFMRKLNWILCN